MARMGGSERVVSLYRYLLQVQVAWHAENILLNLNPGDFDPSGRELEFHCNACVARYCNLPLLTAYE